MPTKVTDDNSENTNYTEIQKLAESLDITLDKKQLNIGGERSIMSPDKFVLTGIKNSTQAKVVLKCAKKPAGVKEMEQEHKVRSGLKGLPFAERELIMPEEIFYGRKGEYIVSVTAFIEQDKVFTDHTLQEQFFMSLYALECQESFHVTTREHHATIRNQFEIHSPDFYIAKAKRLADNVKQNWPESSQHIDKAIDELSNNRKLLNSFNGYLIHSDFVPHNFRIKNRQLYLLDFVSFRLGNKYESWARFINFMEVHSPKLVPLLLDFVKRSRGEQEYKSLRLMRLYKIIFLLNYYANTLTKTEEDLRALTESRLTIWTHILESVLADTKVDEVKLENYYQERSNLRTDTEKERQRQFTWA